MCQARRMDIGAGRTASVVDRALTGPDLSGDSVTYITTLPERRAVTADWPSWVCDFVIDRLRATGIERPWAHQAQAASAAFSGEHVVVSTGTASGKSLAYQLPVLTAVHDDPRTCALYLSPTKALGADQLRAVAGLEVPGVRAAMYDGDTPMDERDWVRAHANVVFTNPDMLHHGLLAHHARWERLFRRLAYVVVDECHSYRGVFGSHVALLLRRLRRIAGHYGARPTFVLASATVASPDSFARRLTGVDCRPISQDCSPRGSRTFVLMEPPLLDGSSGENGAPVRRSAGVQAARLLADLVADGARTLAFVRSRRGAELAAIGARRLLDDVDPALTDRVAAYRSGLLPEERRAVEADLVAGRLLGVATTSALELGIDISGLDAVVLAGYPGTLASFWQQAGRAGRSASEALVVLVAGDDPLDTYLVHHPAAVFERPVEATVLDPGNPHVLGPHLVCAAAEIPLRSDELGAFDDSARDVLEDLVDGNVLRRRASGWYWTAPERPHGTVSIRGAGPDQVAIVEADTSRLLGTVDLSAAPATVHEGAVYLHLGDSYVVDTLDLDASVAIVHAEDPGWTTTARSTTDIEVIEAQRRSEFDGVGLCLGSVRVTSQVVGYLRRTPTGKIIDHVPLDLPAQTLNTRAVWYTLSSADLADAGLTAARLPGALHAAEHAAIGMLPLIATCDRWDIGGVSTALHPQTMAPTVFVHDGHPGGAGFADRAHAAFTDWLIATREAIAACECETGCPSCVQSPKCGNGNDPLDKAGAVAVLDLVIRRVDGSGHPPHRR